MALKGNQNDIAQREHDLSREAQRVITTDPFGGIITDGNYLKKIDAADASTTYIGSAQIGTATSAAGWQIKRVYSSGTVTTISWAGGTDGFTNIWDNRAALSYS